MCGAVGRRRRAKSEKRRALFCYIAHRNPSTGTGCALATGRLGPRPRKPHFDERRNERPMSVATTSAVSPATRVMPAVLYFAKDDIGHRMLGGSQRFRRIPIEDLEQ